MGIGGCGFEQQLMAGAVALNGEGQNGFIRPDSLTVVLVVSDEEDCSIKDNGLFWTDEWKSGAQYDAADDRWGLLNTACNYALDNGNNYLVETGRYRTELHQLRGGGGSSGKQPVDVTIWARKLKEKPLDVSLWFTVKADERSGSDMAADPYMMEGDDAERYMRYYVKLVVAEPISEKNPFGRTFKQGSISFLTFNQSQFIIFALSDIQSIFNNLDHLLVLIKNWMGVNLNTSGISLSIIMNVFNHHFPPSIYNLF